MAGSLNQGEILIYQTEKGDTKVDVFLADETVWMTRNNIAALYSTTPQNISRHIKNIYEENSHNIHGRCNFGCNSPYPLIAHSNEKNIIYYILYSYVLAYASAK